MQLIVLHLCHVAQEGIFIEYHKPLELCYPFRVGCFSSNIKNIINKYKMKAKINNRKITRHKVPNLSRPGLKFDQLSNQNATFFAKVENTFKLLQEPILVKQKDKKDTGEAFYVQKHLALSDRLKSLSKPRPNSENSSIIMKYITPQKVKTKKLNRTKLPEINSSSQFVKNEINGTKLAAMPLENILQERQKALEMKKKECWVETLSEPDSEKQRQIGDDQEQKFRCKQKDPSIWAELIINGQGKVYDYYDKQIMQKTKLYIRKQYKINHQSMWK